MCFREVPKRRAQKRIRFRALHGKPRGQGLVCFLLQSRLATKGALMGFSYRVLEVVPEGGVGRGGWRWIWGRFGEGLRKG